MGSKKKDYLAIARRYYEQHHPKAECAFVAGSFTRGEMKPHSDIDIVVLYKNDKTQPRRSSMIFEGMPIEAFIHTLKAQDYYFAQDSARGMCVMATMTATGHIIGKNKKLAQARKKIAREVIRKGPPPLSEEAIQRSRYCFADGLDDLKDNRPKEQVYSVLALLYTSLADFYLRAKGSWSGGGKSLGRLFKADNPALARRFALAFEKAYRGESFAGVFSIAEEITAPYGGLLWDGYESVASDAWKNFTPPTSKHKKPVRRLHK